jgi:hypothetical protein
MGTFEIGTRMTPGAGAWTIVAFMVVWTMRQVLIGVIVGTVLTIVAARLGS